MSENIPTTDEVREEFVFGHQEVDMDGNVVVSLDEAFARWGRWLAEAERAAAEKALTTMADELAALDDGGKRGLAGHSKSSASAITHRHAVAVVRARAAALGLTAGQEGENE